MVFNLADGSVIQVDVVECDDKQRAIIQRFTSGVPTGIITVNEDQNVSITRDHNVLTIGNITLVLYSDHDAMTIFDAIAVILNKQLQPF